MGLSFGYGTVTDKKEGIALIRAAQVQALEKSFGGAHDSNGKPFYSGWPYDSGVGDRGWRMWKLGTSETAISNALNTTPR